MSKIYCGNGKEKRFDNGGSIIEVLLDVDDLAKNFKEHGFTTGQGKRKIRVKVCQGREVDQYGNTHYVEIDTWKPNQQGQQNGGNQYSPQPQGGPGGENYQDFPRNGRSVQQGQPPVQGTPPPQFEDDIPF